MFNGHKCGLLLLLLVRFFFDVVVHSSSASWPISVSKMSFVVVCVTISTYSDLMFIEHCDVMGAMSMVFRSPTGISICEAVMSFVMVCITPSDLIIEVLLLLEQCGVMDTIVPRSPAGISIFPSYSVSVQCVIMLSWASVATCAAMLSAMVNADKIDLVGVIVVVQSMCFFWCGVIDTISVDSKLHVGSSMVSLYSLSLSTKPSSQVAFSVLVSSEK